MMVEVEVKYVDTPWGKEAVCAKCGSSVEWEDCWECGGSGYSHHDCGEDTCCCLNPEPNVVCDICDGEGGWFTCFNCSQKSKGERIE